MKTSCRICEDIKGNWTLHYYVKDDISGYRCVKGQSRKELIAKAKALSMTHFFDGVVTTKLIAL